MIPLLSASLSSSSSTIEVWLDALIVSNFGVGSVSAASFFISSSFFGIGRGSNFIFLTSSTTSLAAMIFDVRRSFTGVVCTDGEVGALVDCPWGFVGVSVAVCFCSCGGGLGVLLLGVCSALTLVSVGGR